MSSFNSGVLANGIDLGFIGSMVDRVKLDLSKADRTIKAKTVWLGGTRSESTVRNFKYIMDEPWGNVEGGCQPGEMVLAAVGACQWLKNFQDTPEVPVELSFLEGRILVQDDTTSGSEGEV